MADFRQGARMSTTEAAKPEQFRVDIPPTEHVTAITYRAATRDRADIALVLAHGAGANQTNGFMVQFATALAARGIDTVTFNANIGNARIYGVESNIEYRPIHGLTLSLAGNLLNLSWPGDHTGWLLETQTNPLQTALGTNWVIVPGSGMTNDMSFPIGLAKASRGTRKPSRNSRRDCDVRVRHSVREVGNEGSEQLSAEGEQDGTRFDRGRRNAAEALMSFSLTG